MTLAQPIQRVTAEEYLRLERDAVEKHQYYRGEIFSMAGGTARHSLIIANVIGALHSRPRGKPCRVFDSNLRVRVPRTTLYTYPDATIICGELQYDPIDLRKETVLNPTLLVEVLSPTTEAWDRGGKFESYRQIETLREYVLVASDAGRVESFLRQPDGTWLFSAVGMGMRVKLGSMGLEIDVDELYAGVDLEAGREAPRT